MPADLPKRLGPTTLPTSPAAQFGGYTVPANRIFIARSIHACAIAAGVKTFTFSVGTDATGTRYEDACPVERGSPYAPGEFLVLIEGEFFQAFAAEASTINLIISGVETDEPAP